MPRGDRFNGRKGGAKGWLYSRGYEVRGVRVNAAEGRVRATVNRSERQRKKSHFGHGQPKSQAWSRKEWTVAGERRRLGGRPKLNRHQPIGAMITS